MPSRSDVERIQAANRGVVALAGRDLAAFWAALDLNRPEAARDALETFLPVLVGQYGEIAAAAAADWYEDLRDAAGVGSAFRVAPADLVPDAAIRGQVRFAAAALFTDDPGRMLDFLQVAASKYVLQPGRDTITEAAAADPRKPRYARVPSGTETCAFCLMLASRGPVYASAQTAGGRMRKYHGKCDCVPTPLWDGDDLPAGYDPDALYERYNAARAVAGSGATKPILAELRKQPGTF